MLESLFLQRKKHVILVQRSRLAIYDNSIAWHLRKAINNQNKISCFYCLKGEFILELKSLMYFQNLLKSLQNNNTIQHHNIYLAIPFSDYLAIKMRVLIHATMWVNLENMMLHERSQKQRSHILWFHLYVMSRTDKSRETGSTLVVTKEWGGEQLEMGNGS